MRVDTKRGHGRLDGEVLSVGGEIFTVVDLRHIMEGLVEGGVDSRFSEEDEVSLDSLEKFRGSEEVFVLFADRVIGLFSWLFESFGLPGPGGADVDGHTRLENALVDDRLARLLGVVDLDLHLSEVEFRIALVREADFFVESGLVRKFGVQLDILRSVLELALGLVLGVLGG